MSFLMFLKRLKRYLSRMFLGHRHPQVRPKISLLIPFSSKDKERRATFKWVLRYWKHELPEAEIIIGHSRSKIFCKGEALNDAARKAHGRVLVILDADAYMSGKVIERCADRILEHLDDHLWFVPYRHLYRLKREISRLIILTDPEDPLRLSSPPPMDLVENGKQCNYGHRYGAMVMMFPREALDVIGGFDERFKGWGGEDVALLRALDTLYGKHKTTNNDILHLWHPFIGNSFKTRVWEGQRGPNANDRLANAYNRATRKPKEMRELVEAGRRARRYGYPRYDKDD